ncbi:hypothetical protein, partial [Actinomadura geliboluensis]
STSVLHSEEIGGRHGPARRSRAPGLTDAPVTALAAPLLIAGVALRPWSSWHDVAKLAAIAVLLTATGPPAVITAGQAADRATTGRE